MYLIYIYFTLIFLASTLYMTSYFNSIGSILISLFILLFIPIILLIKKKDFELRKRISILMYGFLVVCAISSFKNLDIGLLISGVMISILYFSSFIIIPSFKQINIDEVMYKSILISHIPLIIIPIILYGIVTHRYQGIFYNPNSFGTVVATLFVLLYSSFLFKLENYFTQTTPQKAKGFLGDLIIILITFYLVVISGSRTSLITVVTVTLIGFLLVSIILIRNKRMEAFIRSTFFSVTSIFSIWVLAKVTSFYDYLYINILYKFETKIDNGDVLDDRGYVWIQTISDAGLLGNGSEYFVTETFVAAHNTFVSILGEYGWIALVLFVLFLLYGIIVSTKYSLNNVGNKYKYLPILITICFIMLSIGENMLFKASMIAMFFSLGFVFHRNRYMPKNS